MTPDLTNYHWIVVNSSAGKNSQAMLDYIVELATAAGVRERVVVAHADYGRVAWEGVRELAEEQARHYGLRFETIKREQGDLLNGIEERGLWPSFNARYCISDYRRDQIKRIMTRLVREAWDPKKRQPIRLLNCCGNRAEESPYQARDQVFVPVAYENGRRIVDEWLPIHTWTTQQVWERVKQSGVRYHWAYDRGFNRLNCVFCVFAPKSALMLAATLHQPLFKEYLELERRLGKPFQTRLSLQMIDEALWSGEPAGAMTEGWSM